MRTSYEVDAICRLTVNVDLWAQFSLFTFFLLSVRWCPTVAAAQPLHPHEPPAPSVKTPIPGPESLRLMGELSQIQVGLGKGGKGPDLGGTWEESDLGGTWEEIMIRLAKEKENLHRPLPTGD